MSETASAAREQLLSDLRAVVADSEELLRATAGDLNERAPDSSVREHPWGAVGIAAAAGVLVGVLIARR